MTLAVLMVVSAVIGAQPGTAPTTMRFEQLADRFKDPSYLTAAPGDSRLFVVELAGRIRFAGVS